MELSEFSKLFPLKCSIYRTRGNQEVIIAKFETFYIKIYNYDDLEYLFQGYLYGNPSVIFEEKVESNKLDEFCKKFKREDYLYFYMH